MHWLKSAFEVKANKNRRIDKFGGFDDRCALFVHRPLSIRTFAECLFTNAGRANKDDESFRPNPPQISIMTLPKSIGGGATLIHSFVFDFIQIQCKK